MAYEVTTSTSTTLTFETQSYLTTAKPLLVDSNHAIIAWGGGASGLTGRIQVLTFDTSTYAVTTAGASLTFDATEGIDPTLIQIDSNHFLGLYRGPVDDGFAQVFTVNTSTWAVTTAAASLEYDTQNGVSPAVSQIDSNHFLAVWSGGASQYAMAQVLTVNTSTWAVTTSGALKNYRTAVSVFAKISKIDSNHFLVLNKDTSGYIISDVLAVNTSTWAVTTSTTSVNIDTGASAGGIDSLLPVDSNHFIAMWTGGTSGYNLKTQVIEVNTSTWAISKMSSSLLLINTSTYYQSACIIDSNHFIDVYSTGTNFEAVVTQVNTSTWAVTTASSALTVATSGQTITCLVTSRGKVLTAYRSSGLGISRFLSVNVPPVASGSSNNLLLLGIG